MNLEKIVDAFQRVRIQGAIRNLARFGEASGRIRLVAQLPLTFKAIMDEVVAYQRHNPSISPHDVQQFRKELYRIRRESPSVVQPMRTITDDSYGTLGHRDEQQRSPHIQVPTDANGMCYPRPNGGKRILPSIYTRIRKWWMRANGVTVEIPDMNDGHLENTIKLLHESHGNLIARSTELLGKMANHFHHDAAIVQSLEDLCKQLQKVDIDTVYPIFKDLATEAAQRKDTPPMLVAIDPGWFEDGELDWSNK